MWEKRSLFENAARVPLIIRVPWLKAASSGARTRGFAELVDIYKTVCELLDVDLPSKDTYAIEGQSLVPLLRDPSATGWSKAVALTTFPRCPRSVPLNSTNGWFKNSCIHSTEASDFGFMGYSMRIDDEKLHHEYRFTMWVEWNGTALGPLWSNVHSVELYNHTPGSSTSTSSRSEFDLYENINLAKTAPPALVAQLTARLKHEFNAIDVRRERSKK
jgi:hypothetical protein